MFVGFCIQVLLRVYFGDFIKSVSKKESRKTLPLPKKESRKTLPLPKKESRKTLPLPKKERRKVFKIF